jgi:hypothetical protein
MSERGGPRVHHHERLGEGPAKPGPRVLYADVLAGAVPEKPERPPADVVEKVAAAPVSCSCGWCGTFSGLTKAGKCPECKLQRNLVRL